MKGTLSFCWKVCSCLWNCCDILGFMPKKNVRVLFSSLSPSCIFPFSHWVCSSTVLGTSRCKSNTLNMKTPVSCYSSFDNWVGKNGYPQMGNESVLPCPPSSEMAKRGNMTHPKLLCKLWVPIMSETHVSELMCKQFKLKDHSGLSHMQLLNAWKEVDNLFYLCVFFCFQPRLKHIMNNFSLQNSWTFPVSCDPSLPSSLYQWMPIICLGVSNSVVPEVVILIITLS